MNAPLRRVAISVLALFTLLILNVNYIQVIRSSELRDDPSNTRLLYEEYDRERGSIVVDGNPVALSVRTDDQLTYLRQYPQGPVYAPATGFYSLIYGNRALEKAGNDVLSGSDPRLVVRRLGDLFTGRDPSGGNVSLTLDPAVQEAAMNALQGVTGAVVALDPKTGAILGLASTPTYDPGKLSSHDPAEIRAYHNQVIPPDGSDQANPLTNQAISERYAPGSVFKLIIAAAALASGNYTPETAVPAPDVLTLPGTSTPLNNYNGESCNGGADQPLIDALTISCNTAFAQLGITLGEDTVRNMAEAFGIDDGGGFDMPLHVVPSKIGDIADDAALGQSSIGQKDVQLTAMQAAMISAAIANKGTLMKPYLVDSIQAPDLTVIDQTDPDELGKPIAADVADELTTMMTSVVANGTGRKARIDGVQVAGKTGTAEVGTSGDDAPPHTWFTGFAPAEDPQIAVAVFIRNGGQSGTEGTGTGGDISAPVAKKVIQAYLDAHGGG
ncbi:cell elongation-specific peptidoglycan D,D-transpeptidase [Modestobacter sp. DSM 44400]|uniref:peptidoglycan D,D-transpeptidase FtsI family protein n=1 Tax=Modestobacter sp. DSM 44400 TaxID=1550230 RepID=UPI0008999025|nr:penicillin-binding protein 2 [Modestobacter sp. DSM 44400]SDY23900.1 cell elongation-specific peptidoglycan D,D-transpeptidase [Modestobacter sp. DSM 44400]